MTLSCVFIFQSIYLPAFITWLNADKVLQGCSKLKIFTTNSGKHTYIPVEKQVFLLLSLIEFSPVQMKHLDCKNCDHFFHRDDKINKQIYKMKVRKTKYFECFQTSKFESVVEEAPSGPLSPITTYAHYVTVFNHNKSFIFNQYLNIIWQHSF